MPKTKRRKKVNFRSLLTHLQYYILKIISEEGPCRFQTIHQLHGASTPALYQALRPLEAKKLIKVDRSENRKYVYSITASGMKAMTKVEAIYSTDLAVS